MSMMSRKQFIESQKDCADMLGMSLVEYQEYCKNVKVPEIKTIKKYDNSILSKLGLTSKDLKVRRN